MNMTTTRQMIRTDRVKFSAFASLFVCLYAGVLFLQSTPAVAPSIISIEEVFVVMSEDAVQAQVAISALSDRIEQSLPQRDESEAHCLAQAIYYEARGEPLPGQIAVAEVVLNRKDSKRYPDTICAVVFQNEHRKNRCQFSFACDGKTDNPPSGKTWNKSVSLANYVLADGSLRLTDAATHYHADYVSPFWSKHLEKTVSIGQHIFYKRDSA